MAKDLLSRNAAQIAEAESPFNMWVTGVELKHPPTQDEALAHYIKKGGAKHFAEKKKQETDVQHTGIN